MPRMTNWWRPNDKPQAQNETNSDKKAISMKTNEPKNKREESTYSLLVRSEEKKRSIIEVVVYGLVILSAVAAILEFANEFFWYPA
jgi:hypothetical protein